MRQSWRLAPWHDPRRVTFVLEIDGNDAQLINSPPSMVLRLPYKNEVFTSDDAVRRGVPELIALEGWFGLGKAEVALTGRIPSQIVMPNGYFLDIPVTQELLESLEATRGTGDMLIKIMLGGVAKIPVPSTGKAADTDAALQSEVAAVRSGTMPDLLKIGREKWLEILAAGGRKRFRLIELPIPETRTLAEITRLLESAVANLRGGDWRDAVSKSRLIVEGLILELSAHWGVPRPTDGSRTKWAKDLGNRLSSCWPEDRESGTLLGSLLAAAWAWTAEEHHYVGSSTSKRVEAEFALGLVTDLFLLGNELMECHPSAVGKSSQ